MTDLRKIDALVAEHVFGFAWDPGGILKDPNGYCVVQEKEGEPTWYCENTLPHYSTDIALAIGVLEKLNAERGWHWVIRKSDARSSYETCIDPEPNSGKDRCGLQFSTSLPEAICRHVLHVLGVAV